MIFMITNLAKVSCIYWLIQDFYIRPP